MRRKGLIRIDRLSMRAVSSISYEMVMDGDCAYTYNSHMIPIELVFIKSVTPTVDGNLTDVSSFV